MENEQVISNNFLENQTLSEKLTSIDSLKIQEPVILADGYTYEKALIEEWLKSHDISPITKLKLAHKDLMPNHTLKQLQLKCQQLSKENESLKMHQLLFIQATHFINTLKENIKQHEELMEKIKNQEEIIQYPKKSVEKIEMKLVKENPRLSVNIIFLLWCFKSYNKLEKKKVLYQNQFNIIFLISFFKGPMNLLIWFIRGI